MLSSSDVSVNSSRFQLNEIIDTEVLNNESTPLLSKNVNAAPVSPANNLPNIKDIYAQYKLLQQLVKRLERKSSYREIPPLFIVGCISADIAAVVCMLGLISATVVAIYFMHKNNGYNLSKKYAAHHVPGTNISCTKAYKSSTGYSQYGAGFSLEQQMYCEDKYTNDWWLVVTFYLTTIVGSVGVAIALCFIGIFAVAAAIGCITSLFKEQSTLEISHLKPLLKEQFESVCRDYNIIISPNQKPVEVVKLLNSIFDRHYLFIDFVDQTRNVNSYLHRLPADIALLVGALADLTNLKTKELVISHSLSDSHLAKVDRFKFTSAFYAANETAATFDAGISAAAAAARAPASSRLLGVSACVSDAIVEPESYPSRSKASI